MTSAPIIVTASLGAEDFAWLDALRRSHFPPERNQLFAHLTLFHHLPPSVAGTLDDHLKRLATGPPPRATIDQVLLFGRGVALGVRSPELEAIRGDLSDALTGLLTPQDTARWRPHVTIQNKVEPQVARTLHSRLAAGFVPRPLAVRGLASFFYRGGPWEAIGDYPFRGLSRSGRSLRS